jgi:hypothetical protein
MAKPDKTRPEKTQEQDKDKDKTQTNTETQGKGKDRQNKYKDKTKTGQIRVEDKNQVIARHRQKDRTGEWRGEREDLDNLL